MALAIQFVVFWDSSSIMEYSHYTVHQVRLSFQCQDPSALHKASPNYRRGNGFRFNQKTKQEKSNETKYQTSGRNRYHSREPVDLQRYCLSFKPNNLFRQFDLIDCQPLGTVLSCSAFLLPLQTAQNLQTKPGSINIQAILTVNSPNFSLQLFIDIAILYRTQNSSWSIGFTPSKW
ncbi:hypothetical protein XENTR_v10015071 [Xenopus tropicalis]|nr:hypothetical protein XENTR_v10015071 [Xenopus tropicalis]